MSYRVVGEKVLGRIDGKELEFESVRLYEDAYYDWLFKQNNGFVVEMPEDF